MAASDIETPLPAPAPAPDPTPGNQEIDFRELLPILARRWQLMVVVALVVFGLVAFVTFTQKKIYESATKVVVEGKHSQGADTASLIDLFNLQGTSVKTQVEIINSSELLEEAFDTLTPDEQQKGFGSKSPPLWSYTIRAIEDTDVILITTRAREPKVAAKFANAIVNTYLKRDVTRNTQATRQGREYVQRERSSTELELLGAAAELANFKRKTGLVAPEPQVTQLATQLGQLRADQTVADKEVGAATMKLREIESQLRQLDPNVDLQQVTAENPEYAGIRTQIALLEEKAASLRQEYTPQAPERVTVEKDLADLRARLKQVPPRVVAQSVSQRNPQIEGLRSLYATYQGEVIAAQAKKSGVAAQLERLQAAVNQFPEQERQYAVLQQRVDGLKETYEILSKAYYELQVQERSNVPRGMVANKAEPSRKPSSPVVPTNLAIGALLAVFMAVLAGVIANYLDNKLHKLEDVERISGAPILSLVPEVTASNDETGNLYIGKAAPVHAFLEAMRMLRNNLAFKLPGKGCKVVAVSSALLGEGKSTIASNLAIALSMDRKKVLVIEVDLRRPTVHTKFALAKEPGISNLIMGTATEAEVTQRTAWENLSAISSGPLPPDPVEFLNSPESREVIRMLREKYDYIVLDAPPCIGLSDMQVISSVSDGIVLVTALDRTTKQQLGGAIRMINQAGGRLTGHVVNRVQPQSGSAYGYYGSYGYYGYYGYSAYDEETGEGKKKGRSRKKG